MLAKLLWWLLGTRASWLFNLVPWPCRTWPWIRQFYWQEGDIERAKRLGKALFSLLNATPEKIEQANSEVWDVIREDKQWKKISTDTRS